MTEHAPVKSRTPADVAREVADVKMFDPGLGSYGFGNLGEVVKFADLMSKAGMMIPEHLRDKPAVCLAVTMRATQWQMDPFALAMETYQASPNSPVGYQAKVFAAALKQCAGIRLQYRYEGEIARTGEEVKSARGNSIAPNGYKGDMRCIAFAEVDGVTLEYATPPYDEINPKNSPLWHNDARQQLAYYAARGWTRLHEPGVMMGAYSIDEVQEMDREMRDVTPKERKPSGFAAMVQQARAKETAPAEPEEAEEIQPGAGEPEPHWTEALDPEDGAPGSDDWDAGVAAHDAGEPSTACPDEMQEHPDRAADWLGGWHGARRAAE